MEETQAKQEQSGEEEDREQSIVDFGSAQVESARGTVHILTIVGQVEGHQLLPPTTKSTKYEHVMPLLATVEESDEVDGLLILLNTMGGDIEAGLGIAELIASMSKPTVSLVLGGGHSIGVPIAVSADYSFIVESATMVVHPVRMNGMVIGTPATYDYFKSMQDRITGFVVSHSNISQKTFEKLLMETKMLTKDVGTVLVGCEAVKEGIINEIGGLKEAKSKLYELIDNKK